MRSTITAAGLLALAAALGLGCPGVNQRKRDIDRTPVTDFGTGASILYPGQSPPVYQGGQHPKQTGQGSFGSGNAPAQAPAPTSQASPTSQPAQPAQPPQLATASPPAPAPRGGGSHITMIGGNTTEQESHISIDEKPIWWKYVTLPVAVAAAPFKYAYDSLRPEPEAGPEVPTLENAPPPAPPAPAPTDRAAPGSQRSAPGDYESHALQQLERELDQRQAPGGEDAFAAELALLREQALEPQAAPEPGPHRAEAAPPPDAPSAPVAEPQASPPRPREDPSLATASGQVDRNADGRIDQWIFRERGEIVRELYDEDFDGRPDRTLHYDLASHQVDAIEEDSDHDGRTDTWTALRDGSIQRRRSDTDGDGHVDTWGFYRDGELSRLERDSDGDGFRDRVTRYENGHLAREDQDDDADGRVEIIRYYDDQQRVIRLDEDTDRDGNIDLITYYKDGRLHRREILDTSALVPAPSLSGHN